VTTTTGAPVAFGGSVAVGATVSATATCPAGKTLLGGGANVTGNSAANAVAALTGSWATTSGVAGVWTATATEVIHTANGSPPTVTAYVFCAG
jgi:hypothetical protein